MILGFNIVKNRFFSKNDYFVLNLTYIMIYMHINDKYMILGFKIVNKRYF